VRRHQPTGGEQTSPLRARASARIATLTDLRSNPFCYRLLRIVVKSWRHRVRSGSRRSARRIILGLGCRNRPICLPEQSKRMLPLWASAMGVAGGGCGGLSSLLSPKGDPPRREGGQLVVSDGGWKDPQTGSPGVSRTPPVASCPRALRGPASPVRRTHVPAERGDQQRRIERLLPLQTDGDYTIVGKFPQDTGPSKSGWVAVRGPPFSSPGVHAWVAVRDSLLSVPLSLAQAFTPGKTARLRVLPSTRPP